MGWGVRKGERKGQGGARGLEGPVQSLDCGNHGCFLVVSYVGENPGQKTALGSLCPSPPLPWHWVMDCLLAWSVLEDTENSFSGEKLVTKHPQPRRTAPALQAGKAAVLLGGGKEGGPGISSCLLLPEGKAHTCGLGRQGPNPAGFLARSSISQHAAQSLEEKVEPQLC